MERGASAKSGALASPLHSIGLSHFSLPDSEQVMAFKVSFFFEQRASKIGGWTESFWSNATSLQLVQNRVNTLRPILQAVHGFQTILNYQRISNVDNFREVEITDFSGQLQQNNTTNDTYGSDYPTNALLLKLVPAGEIAYVTRQWIKGIPDSQVIPPGRYVPSGDYPGRITALTGKLTSGNQNWAVRVLTKSGAEFQNKLVTAVDLLTGIVTVAEHPYQTGDKVRISRTKLNKYINRVWEIERITANTFRLVTWDTTKAGTANASGGKARKQTYVYPSITDASIVRATAHKVGRPFGQLSGRRKRPVN